MIIFYSKETGEIEGTVDGRMHGEDQLKMWIGDKDKTDRLIVEFIKTGENIEIYYEPILEEYVDKEGFTVTREVGKKKKKRITSIFEPNHKQKDLFNIFDKKSSEVYKYRVDLDTKELVKLNK